MKTWVLSHKLVAGILALLVIIMAVLLFWVETSNAPAPSETLPSSSETTIEGEVVCLPHKDTEGPQTLECALGVKLDDGTHYALRAPDDNDLSISKLPTGQRARLTGTLKKEQSDNYQSTGTFTVINSEVIE